MVCGSFQGQHLQGYHWKIFFFKAFAELLHCWVVSARYFWRVFDWLFWECRKSSDLPSVAIMNEARFCFCNSLKSGIFDSHSKLSRLEKFAFRDAGLGLIHLFSSVEVICEACFSCDLSLLSVTFDCVSKLRRIEKDAFRETGLPLTSIHIPSWIVLFVKTAFAFRSHLKWLHLMVIRNCLALRGVSREWLFR